MARHRLFDLADLLQYSRRHAANFGSSWRSCAWSDDFGAHSSSARIEYASPDVGDWSSQLGGWIDLLCPARLHGDGGDSKQYGVANGNLSVHWLPPQEDCTPILDPHEEGNHYSSQWFIHTYVKQKRQTFQVPQRHAKQRFRDFKKSRNPDVI